MAAAQKQVADFAATVAEIESKGKAANDMITALNSTRTTATAEHAKRAEEKHDALQQRGYHGADSTRRLAGWVVANNRFLYNISHGATHSEHFLHLSGVPR